MTVHRAPNDKGFKPLPPIPEEAEGNPPATSISPEKQQKHAPTARSTAVHLSSTLAPHPQAPVMPSRSSTQRRLEDAYDYLKNFPEGSAEYALAVQIRDLFQATAEVDKQEQQLEQLESREKAVAKREAEVEKRLQKVREGERKLMEEAPQKKLRLTALDAP